MAELTIPEEHYSNFIEFIELPLGIKDQLFSNLNNAEELNPNYLVEYISTRIPSISKDVASNIISVYLN